MYLLQDMTELFPEAEMVVNIQLTSLYLVITPCFDKLKGIIVQVIEEKRCSAIIKDTHHADLCGYQVAESVEPLHIRLQVAGFLMSAKTFLRRHFDKLSNAALTAQ